MNVKTNQRLLKVASGRGFVTRQDLLADGLSVEEISRYLTRGKLMRLVKNAYVISPPRGARKDSQGGSVHAFDLQFDLRAHALMRVTSQESPQAHYLSRFGAVRMHGLPVLREGRTLDLVTAQAAGRRCDGTRVHSPKVARELVENGGICLVSMRDSLLEAVCALRRIPPMLVMLDAYFRRVAPPDLPRRGREPDLAFFREQTVNDLMERAQVLRLRPSDLVRQALAVAHPQSESPLESLGRAEIWGAGLTMFRPQVAIDTPYGRCYPDLFSAQHAIAIEFDGDLKYHERPEATVLAERERERWLLNQGIRVLRFSWRQVRDGAMMIWVIERALSTGVHWA